MIVNTNRAASQRVKLTKREMSLLLQAHGLCMDLERVAFDQDTRMAASAVCDALSKLQAALAKE